MSDFKKLKVWEKAHNLAAEVINAVESRKAPSHTELKRQLTRSALSIESCIAEGSGRESDREFARFLRISRGSCNELEAQLLTARRVKFLPQPIAAGFLHQVEEVRKMLSGLIKYLDGRTDSAS
jgi:four helix bundle protein